MTANGTVISRNDREKLSKKSIHYVNSELPVGWGRLVLSVVCWKLLMKEPPHVTRLLGARGLSLLIILSLELERLLLLLRNQIKHEEKLC